MKSPKICAIILWIHKYGGYYVNKKLPFFILLIITVLVVATGFYKVKSVEKGYENLSDEYLTQRIETQKQKENEEETESESYSESVEPRGEELVYAAMGDSLTNGFYASTKDKRFTSVYENMLINRLGYDVISGEESQYGGTSENGLQGLESIKQQQPDLVTIEFGTNDSDPNNGSDLDTFIANINLMIDGLLEGEDDPYVILVTTWNQGDKAIPFDNAIKEIGKERDLPVAELNDIWMDSSNKGPEGIETFVGTSDNWHPNDKGMELIAEKIFEVSKDLLK